MGRRNSRTRVVSSVTCLLLLISMTISSTSKAQERKASLPGRTDKDGGSLELKRYEAGAGLECEKGMIVVPENRFAETPGRNIKLYFYRVKSRSKEQAKLPPVVFMPGGPGGFYEDRFLKMLGKEPRKGTLLEAWTYAENRDVLLVNQRGARSPDRSFQFFAFFGSRLPGSVPIDDKIFAESLENGIRRGVKRWTEQGMDLAGYDIMNMVEDIDQIRKSLEYDKIALRGTSFGSQWSMSYMRKYPENVDRAILAGVEPIDFGWDSPQGVWKVFQRLDKRVQKHAASKSIELPDSPVTTAIMNVVNRLQEDTVDVEGKAPGKESRLVEIGLRDFRNLLRQGINARKESRQSLQNFPKFVMELDQENYEFLAGKIASTPRRPIAGLLQPILIDNSLGISDARLKELDAEPANRWLGDINLIYRTSRKHTPTRVVPDEFRKLKTDIPILMIQGDLDLSTPFENATAQLADCSNAHLIRIVGGTHGAVNEAMSHDEKFLDNMTQFLNADLSDDQKVSDLNFPETFDLPPLEFNLGEKSLYQQWEQSKK